MPVPPTQQWQTGILTCLITGHARLFILQKNSTLTQSFTEEKKGVDFSPRTVYLILLHTPSFLLEIRVIIKISSQPWYPLICD